MEDEDSIEIDGTDNTFLQEDDDEIEEFNSNKLQPSRDDFTLKMLFQEMNIGYCYQSFIASGFTHERLRYLSYEDLDLIFPGKHNIGLRAELREKIINQWKAINFPTNDKEETAISFPENWLATQSLMLIDETRDDTRDGLKEDTRDSLSSVDANSVQEILENSKTGKRLLLNYTETKILDNTARKKLVNVITEHFMSQKKLTTPSSHLLKTISEEIVQVFPTENKDIYYISRRESGKSNPMGMLFNKFNNVIRADRKNLNKLKDNSPPSSSSMDTKVNVNMKPNKFEPIVKSLQNKMKFMNGKESDAFTLWTNTFDYRLNQLKIAPDINSIIEQWPFFKGVVAYKFIEYDFERLYPDSQYKLMDKWFDFKKQLILLYKTHIKDRHYQQILQTVENVPIQNANTDCIFIRLMCSILRSTGRYFTEIDGKKVINNLTIKDTVDSLIVHIKNISDLDKIKDEKRQQAFERKSQIQPFIIAIGMKLNDLTEFYVLYGNVLQKFSSFIPALDFCFKTFHVFHLHYPLESSSVWCFLQKHIYEIHTANDLKSPKLSEILDYFKNINK